MTHIESRKNPLVQHVSRLLTDARYRAERGEFAAEGTKLLSDALDAGIEPTAVLFDETAELDELLRRVDGFVSPEKDNVAARVVTLPHRVFAQLSTHKTPQGVVFAAKLPRRKAEDVRLVLDGVQDPGNVGTILRTAAALGLGSVLLTGGSADPYSPKTVRASMGGVFRVAVLQCAADEIQSHLNGRRLLCATPSREAESVTRVNWRNAAAVIGSEGRGVSDAVLALCSGEFTIPMQSAESLNAAVAAAITMWEMTV